MELQRDQKPLQRPQRRERDQKDQRDPQRGMHPIWRRIVDLDRHRREDDDESADQDDEYGRTVAGIGEAVVQTAAVAGLAQSEEAFEQGALAATRTASAQAAANRLGQGLFGHLTRISQNKRAAQ